jgi:hypothetical protein
MGFACSVRLELVCYQYSLTGSIPLIGMPLIIPVAQSKCSSPTTSDSVDDDPFVMKFLVHRGAPA